MCVVVLLAAAGWWFCRGPLVKVVYLSVSEYLSVYVNCVCVCACGCAFGCSRVVVLQRASGQWCVFGCV